MAIDLKTETLLSLRQAAIRVGVDYNTIYAWAKRGHGGRRLEVVHIGPRHMRTSVEALARWTDHFGRDKGNDGEATLAASGA